MLFRSIKGYQLNQHIGLTSAMEDYLEMIYRMLQHSQQVRVNELSKSLHVKPSSTSKMVQQLSDLGYIQGKKYGVIAITDKGEDLGRYLLHRHNIIHDFLRLLNHSDTELEEAEKIEHFLSKRTVENLNNLTNTLIANKIFNL